MPSMQILLAALALPALLQDPDGPVRSGVVEVPPPAVAGPGGPGPDGGVGPNVRVNQDNSGEPQNETAVAVNPNDPFHVVGGANDYRNGDARCGWYTSFDGGMTWQDGTFPLFLTYDASGDPDLAFDSAGNLYYSCLVFQRDGGSPPSGVYVHKSVDGGLTWSGPVPVAVAGSNEFMDKEFMEVDRTGGPHDGNIYVSWTRFANNTEIHFSRSTDGGATFSTPMEISEIDSNQGSMPLVGPNGDVYVLWRDYASTTIQMDRSTDGGVTFGADRTVASVSPVSFPLPGWSFRGNTFPYGAVDTSGGPFDGRIYVVWNDDRRDTADVFMTWSDNGGQTWANPFLVSDGPLGRLEFFPFVTVDERGRVDLMWYTNEYTFGLIDVKVRRSDDGGATWEPGRRVTTVSFNPANDGFGGAFIGDYNAMASSANALYPLWTDTRSGSESDVYTARAELSILLDAATISNSNPQPLTISLDGGPDLAGQGYQVLGSCTGTSPGTPFGNVIVPLVADNCWNKVLSKTNTAALQNFAGVLDAQGRATARLRLHAGRLRKFVGRTAWFAWVSTVGGIAVTTSHPCPIDVVP